MKHALNHAGDRIVTFISLGDVGGVEVMSRGEFLQRFPESWQDLLASGLSMYISTQGKLLAVDEARQHLEQLVS